MKKFLSVVLCVGMLISCLAGIAYAETPVRVELDGALMEFDVEPVIENGRTLVPFRAIFEALDCAVAYIEDDGEQYVVAEHGNASILLTIGEAEIMVNGEEIALDVAPKITNGRTLVPLRAVSECLECEVDWDAETYTAKIRKPYGKVGVSSGRIEETIKAEDGTALMYIYCVYPVLAGDSDFVKTINKEYAEQTEQGVAAFKAEYAQVAKEMYATQGEEFYAMVYSSRFAVTTNRTNWLSIRTDIYTNTQGAHPSYESYARTFQPVMEKELALTDIMAAEQENVEQTVFDAFVAYFEALEGFEMTDETAKLIGENAKDVEWYLTDNSLVMFFNPYAVGPYAIGAPLVEIPYEKDGAVVRIDLSEAELDALTFTLDENPTTGYTWVSEADEARLAVVHEFKAPETELDGAPGVATFNVTGLKYGNATLKLTSQRSADDVAKTIIYELFVDANNKITVIDRIEK